MKRPHMKTGILRLVAAALGAGLAGCAVYEPTPYYAAYPPYGYYPPPPAVSFGFTWHDDGYRHDRYWDGRRRHWH